MNLNSKRLEVKRQHHHVWASYMRRWSPDNNRDVWYTTEHQKIARASVKRIAVEPDLYRVQRLTEEHIEIIKMLLINSPKPLQQLQKSLLTTYLYRQRVEDHFKSKGIQDSLSDNIFDALKGNGIEDFHSAHEKEVQDILKELANRDLSVLTVEDNMISFLHFLGHQIIRTKTKKDQIISSYHFINPKIANLMEESWWFLGYIFGMNIGESFFNSKNKDTHCLVVNDTDIPFITSDQPIINSSPSLNDEIRPPEDHEYDLYYPISPGVAYMINKSNRFPRGKVQASREFVDEMNIKIAKDTNVYLISNDKDILHRYQKYVGHRFRLMKQQRT